MNNAPAPVNSMTLPVHEVRMFCRGQDQSISIQEFRPVDEETGNWQMGGKCSYIGHAVAFIKCRTDQGLQEIPHQFQFPIEAENIADAFKKYEAARHSSFQVEMQKLRSHAIASGATLNEMPKEVKR